MVGSRHVVVHDVGNALSFPLWLLYPTKASSQTVRIGPYSMDLAVDSAIADGTFPVVILSHGGGGTPLVYRSIASFLAKNGFIVGLPEHYGNHRISNQLDGTIKNLELRPRHISLCADAIAADTALAGHLAAAEFAVIGHSMGGYGALACAGGVPWGGMEQKAIATTKDSRIKALVLLAPATGWFGISDALQAVRTPIMLRAAEHDRITPTWQSQLLLDLLPDRSLIDFQIVGNAGHFSFLSPFPANMRRLGLIPAIDPDGFDRDAYHHILNRDLLDFLRRTLV